MDQVTSFAAKGPRPKYEKLRLVLSEMISNELEENSPIPSESELQETYGISRMTVRKAVDQLVNEGLLYRVSGVGTFVAEHKANVTLHLSSFTEDMESLGLAPTQRLLRLERLQADQRLSEELQVPPGAEVICLERLRLVSGRPVSHELSHLPAALLPGFPTSWGQESLYRLLDTKYGVRPTWSTQKIGAAPAASDIAGLLDVQPGYPLLRIRQYAHHEAQLVEFTVSSYRFDSYELSVTLNGAGAVISPVSASSETF